jgi:hypothetical protein
MNLEVRIQTESVRYPPETNIDEVVGRFASLAYVPTTSIDVGLLLVFPRLSVEYLPNIKSSSCFDSSTQTQGHGVRECSNEHQQQTIMIPSHDHKVVV